MAARLLKSAPLAPSRLVRAECVALARGLAVQNALRKVRNGKFPPMDAIDGLVRGWSIDTLRAHDPQLADRCAAILDAIDTPLKPQK
jgi:hypothetical protein